jgi:RNA methyltransferase, TrmH family
LGRRSARLEEGAFVVEGRSLITQAVAAGWRAERQFVTADGTAVDDAGPVSVLGPNVIERVASTDAAQPNIAVFALQPAVLRSDAGFVVVADGVADPGNLGTIIRSAEAGGADGVVVTPGTVDAFNPKAVRAAAGSLFRVPVVAARLDDLTAVVRIGTSSHRGTVYTELDLRRPVALCVGNEAHGMNPAAVVDEWTTIPHAGAAESLNVAMAATVLIFEVARQRRSQLESAP